LLLYAASAAPPEGVSSRAIVTIKTLRNYSDNCDALAFVRIHKILDLLKDGKYRSPFKIKVAKRTGRDYTAKPRLTPLYR
jgi:hypothetical protein